ncbi:hypothetical protein AAU61_01450 [Desulfocarbo indianensis]|nr:hypothetical protein AAU61_01450 [Desulfocarbo indianensis]
MRLALVKSEPREQWEARRSLAELPGAESLSREELARVKTVLEEYARGDLPSRLSLFLNHRDLRAAFMKLDRIE